MDLHCLTIHELHDLLVKKEVTSREATGALYQRIREVEGKIKAYLLILKIILYHAKIGSVLNIYENGASRRPPACQLRLYRGRPLDSFPRARTAWCLPAS